MEDSDAMNELVTCKAVNRITRKLAYARYYRHRAPDELVDQLRLHATSCEICMNNDRILKELYPGYNGSWR